MKKFPDLDFLILMDGRRPFIYKHVENGDSCPKIRLFWWERGVDMNEGISCEMRHYDGSYSYHSGFYSFIGEPWILGDRRSAARLSESGRRNGYGSPYGWISTGSDKASSIIGSKALVLDSRKVKEWGLHQRVAFKSAACQPTGFSFYQQYTYQIWSACAFVRDSGTWLMYLSFLLFPYETFERRASEIGEGFACSERQGGRV